MTPGVNGPRSFRRTATLRPVFGLPITRQVPKGNDLCAVGPALEVVEKYKETLKKYPNPPAGNLMRF